MKKIFFLLFLALTTASMAHAETLAPKEYEVKAAFLYNFAKFVEWPSAVSLAPEDSFVIGIFGEDPFGYDIDDILEGKTIADKKIVIRRFKSVKEITDSPALHILFVSASEDRSLRELAKELEGKTILTVGETRSFAQNGGMVNFYIDENRVRFEINPKATQKAGLKVSAQLLKLARLITSP